MMFLRVYFEQALRGYLVLSYVPKGDRESIINVIKSICDV